MGEDVVENIVHQQQTIRWTGHKFAWISFALVRLSICGDLQQLTHVHTQPAHVPPHKSHKYVLGLALVALLLCVPLHMFIYFVSRCNPVS